MLHLGLAPGLAAAPAVNGFVPTDLDNLELFVVSTDFGPQAIATCNTQACYDEPFTEKADISRSYCDTVAGAIPGAVGYAPEGCVRWWEDQGPFDCGVCGTGEQDDEWVRGHRHGQDDLQKPALVTDCFHGQPCARLPRVSEMGPNATQIACHELESDDSLEIAGAFSAILLVAPRDQNADWWYFGAPNNGLLHSVMNDSLFFRASSSELMPITVAGAVDPSGGVWQLIEVYRNGAGRIEVWVDGEEVTVPGPPNNGQVLVHRYLGAQNCNGTTEGLVGDLAAFLLFSDRLTVAERVQLRDWFEAIYQLSRLFDDGFESGGTAAWSNTVGGVIVPP